MLALLIYCDANGIFSSWRIERATHRDIGVRFVAANSHPDHDTIATFRREKRQGRAKGKRPKPPNDTPRRDEQSNLSDPDSRLMRKSKKHEYRQAYNAQAVVDAAGSQLILGARISQCASDRNELVADIAAIPTELGRPEKALADNGYANGEAVKSLAEAGVEALVATPCNNGLFHDGSAK